METEQNQPMEESRNVVQTLLNDGYTSFEVCFTVKLNRRGIMLFLEKKGLIRPKIKDFQIIVSGYSNIHCSTTHRSHGICSLQDIRLFGRH